MSIDKEFVEETTKEMVELFNEWKKQGALKELIEFDDLLEELHMDIYGHDWTKRQILECIVKLKNKVEKRIKELKGAKEQ